MGIKVINASTQKDDFCVNFENSIILDPKNIPPYIETNPYSNLIKGRPTKISSGKKLFAQFEIKKGSFSEVNKGQKFLKEDIQNKNNKTDNSSNKMNFKGIPDKVNFGIHSDYSFLNIGKKK